VPDEGMTIERPDGVTVHVPEAVMASVPPEMQAEFLSVVTYSPFTTVAVNEVGPGGVRHLAGDEGCTSTRWRKEQATPEQMANLPECGSCKRRMERAKTAAESPAPPEVSEPSVGRAEATSPPVPVAIQALHCQIMQPIGVPCSVCGKQVRRPRKAAS
jgi:hypothetical protein